MLSTTSIATQLWMVGLKHIFCSLVLLSAPIWISLIKKVANNMRVHLLSSNVNRISNDILNLTQHEVQEVELLSNPNGEEKPLLQGGQ
jgi:hypothetical protein